MKMPEHSPELVPGLNALKGIGAPAVPVLRRALRSPSDGDRFKAASALGQRGPAANSAVPDLLKSLDDREISVQINAIQALTAIGASSEELISKLIPRLANPNWQMSTCAAELLIRIEKEKKRSSRSASVQFDDAMAFLHATAPGA